MAWGRWSTILSVSLRIIRLNRLEQAVANMLILHTDVVKTRLQKQVVHEGKVPKYTGLLQACFVIAKEEGVLALWKGITPRLLRIMPGQAITFMTYEAVSSFMTRHKII